MRLSPLIICFLLIFSCSVEKELSTIDNLHVLIESLSSDDMQGRNPGTKGGQLAKNYISDQFSSINLKTFRSIVFSYEVPAVSSTVKDSSFLQSHLEIEIENLLMEVKSYFGQREIKRSRKLTQVI